MSTHTAPVTTAVQAGVYVRISHDPDHNELGVQRQEKDCRSLAKRQGWSIVRVYADDDLSAFTGRPRPSYLRLLEDIRAGTVQAVLAWHPDRLHRSTRELDDFIDVVEATGCAVATVQGGSYDLTTASGRMTARVVGAVARGESEHRSERLKRKHEELAQAGKDSGGQRPFGYDERDRKAIRPAEAVLIVEAANRVLAGEGLRSVCRDWNARGIRSVHGRSWSVTVLKRMLVSARISGRRERHTDSKGKRHEYGEIIAPATWPAVITIEQSDRLRAMLSDPSRRQGGHPSKYLLTGGLAVCALCGARMVARARQNHRNGKPSIPSLVCGSEDCGRIRIQSTPLETLVVEAVFQAIDNGALARALRGSGEDRKAVDELLGVEQKLADLAGDWASDRMSRVSWDKARTVLETRQVALKKRVEASRRQVGLDGLPDPLRAAWPSLPLHRQRAVVSALVEAVVVGPGIRGLNRFDPRRVNVNWKA